MCGCDPVEEDASGSSTGKRLKSLRSEKVLSGLQAAPGLGLEPGHTPATRPSRSGICKPTEAASARPRQASSVLSASAVGGASRAVRVSYWLRGVTDRRPSPAPGKERGDSRTRRHLIPGRGAGLEGGRQDHACVRGRAEPLGELRNGAASPADSPPPAAYRSRDPNLSHTV